MKNNILFVFLLSFIGISCSNYEHIPKNINKTSDNGREGLWVIANDTTYGITFIHYKANIETGKYVKYHPNGQVAIKGRYKNGERIHLWKFYFDDGSLGKKINYGKCIFCRKSALINYSW